MKYILLFILIIYILINKIIYYNKNIFKWHCDNIYPFDKKLSKKEIEYINKCIDLSYYELLRVFYYIKYPFFKKLSYFTYSHRIKDNHINSSRIAYGTVSMPKQLYKYVLPILQEKKINCELKPSKNIDFYGIGWDIEKNHFKLYFIFYDYTKIPGIYKKLLPNMDDKYKEGLLSITYLKNTLFERKVYTYPKNKYFAILKSENREEKQHEYKNINLENKINDIGKKILKKYNRSGYMLDTITYKNKNDYTFYFPLV